MIATLQRHLLADFKKQIDLLDRSASNMIRVAPSCMLPELDLLSDVHPAKLSSTRMWVFHNSCIHIDKLGLSETFLLTTECRVSLPVSILFLSCLVVSECGTIPSYLQLSTPITWININSWTWCTMPPPEDLSPLWLKFVCLTSSTLKISS